MWVHITRLFHLRVGPVGLQCGLVSLDSFICVLGLGQKTRFATLHSDDHRKNVLPWLLWLECRRLHGVYMRKFIMYNYVSQQKHMTVSPN